MDIKNSIIHLGEINWFGGFNSKKQGHNRFGFIGLDIYFKAEAFKSPNLEQYIEKSIKNVPVFYSLVNEGREKDGAAWVKLVSETTGDELVEMYKKNESVKQILNDPNNYLPLLKYKEAGKVFNDILHNIGIHAMLEGILKNPHLPSYIFNFLMNSIQWHEMPAKDAIEFFLSVSENWEGKAEILKSTFPVWIDDARVIGKLRKEFFPACISKGIDNQDYAEIAKLFKNVTDEDVKKCMASYLPVDEFISDPEYCIRLPEDKINDIIQEYFNTINEKGPESAGTLLSVIDPFKLPAAAVTLAEQLLEKEMPLSVWKQLSNAEKVLSVLQLSLHLDDVGRWKEPFNKIYDYEHMTTEEKNYSVLAATDFLEIALVDKSKKQSIFDEAHANLEKAIIQDFNSIGTPSQELMQLICRCKYSEQFVCAARYWPNGKTAWCSTRREKCSTFDKKEGDGIDYSKTNYQYYAGINHQTALCRLSMADLLNAIDFVPSLDNVYNPMMGRKWNYEEYPYRISGRIMQLKKLFSHMHCRCGKTMKSNYGYSVKIDARMAITVAYCPDAENEGSKDHDQSVYLNECWNCDEVIDSRESKYKQDNMGRYYSGERKDIKGYYVCMHCGAGTKDMLPSICPNCGNTDQETLEYIITSSNPQKRKIRQCNKCGHASRNWKSRFE